ncbi:hypothetical protein DPEC_G00176030 [Dallia pectoralis]|uniref:Uncharacterized protein n=1 Tax=Dallia pectoralis TaxID=75939 RepID=A0ACC2GEY9_DALPE|nr:hypothetical protein DPEC_G00176030 [Dallia pectoralis]
MEMENSHMSRVITHLTKKNVALNPLGHQDKPTTSSINVIQGYQNPIPGSQHDLVSEASGTPVELCSPTLIPSPPTTKPTSKLPRTNKFRGIVNTASGSGQSYPYANTN